MNKKEILLCSFIAILLIFIVFQIEYYDGIFKTKEIHWTILFMQCLLGNFIGKVSIFLSKWILSLARKDG